MDWGEAIIWEVQVGLGQGLEGVIGSYRAIPAQGLFPDWLPVAGNECRSGTTCRVHR